MAVKSGGGQFHHRRQAAAREPTQSKSSAGGPAGLTCRSYPWRNPPAYPSVALPDQARNRDRPPTGHPRDYKLPELVRPRGQWVPSQVWSAPLQHLAAEAIRRGRTEASHDTTRPNHPASAHNPTVSNHPARIQHSACTNNSASAERTAGSIRTAGSNRAGRHYRSPRRSRLLRRSLLRRCQSHPRRSCLPPP